jgi:myo-inositol-1(or 4)-monophosphatase
MPQEPKTVPQEPETVERREFATRARGALVRAGDLLQRSFRSDGTSLDVRVKEDGSLLTAADLESEREILEVLSPYRSTCTFLTEEGEPSVVPEATFLILVDPLDGTSNFCRRRVGFAVAVALVDTRATPPSVVVSLALEPTTGRLWTAIRGEGCTLEGLSEPRSGPLLVRVSERPPATGELCLDASTTPSEVMRGPNHKARVAAAVLGRYRRFRMTGSNVLMHALVANGSYEAAITDTVAGPFDLAGCLLVEEAGGRVTNLRGEPPNILEDKVVVLSNGLGHDELVEALHGEYAT